MKALCTSLALFPLALLVLAPGGSAAVARAPRATRTAEDPAALVAEGRALLAAGRASEARERFERAATLDSSPLGPRAWVLRAWIAEGRVNDALDGAEALGREGAEGPMLDYLYGMAFATKALGYLRDGTGGGVLAMAFGDAVQFLRSATEAEPERFDDAWPLLAECARQVQELELARRASERALLLQPADPEAALALARIAIAQFAAANGAEATQAQADAHWERAVSVLRAALAGGEPIAPAIRARIATELGHALVWKQELEQASEAYALAIELAPASFDFGRLAGLLDGARLAATCARALELRAARGAEADATLAWWHGWALASTSRWKEAEAAFLESVRLRPDFENSWTWAVHARERDGRQADALALLRERLAEERETMLRALGADPATGLALLDRLVAWSVGRGDLASATEITLLQTELLPDEPRYWNNVGLFRRDEGEALASRARQDPALLEQVRALYEGSLAAYEKALELSPGDPALLNDAAVILQYYLRREPERAKAMYTLALANAERELAREDLEAERRELYRIARRDARDNLEKLAAGAPPGS